MKVINEHKLLKMGLSLSDIDSIDATRADKLLLWGNMLAEEEERQMKKMNKGRK